MEPLGLAQLLHCNLQANNKFAFRRVAGGSWPCWRAESNRSHSELARNWTEPWSSDVHNDVFP